VPKDTPSTSLSACDTHYAPSSSETSKHGGQTTAKETSQMLSAYLTQNSADAVWTVYASDERAQEERKKHIQDVLASFE